MSGGIETSSSLRWRFRCPYCESVSITRRVRTSDYRCNRCGMTFSRPVDTGA